MNPIFQNFLRILGESDLHNAYSVIPEYIGDPVDQKIADELRAICTSHFIRLRSNKLNALINLKRSGFEPNLVFDVGAQIGTPELYNAYPEAHHVFIEPVTECIPILKNIATQLRHAQVMNCAISNINGTTDLSVTSSKQYSSIDMKVGDDSRKIEVKTMDSIYEDLQIKGPILLKIDVDGIEVKVLQGAKSILQNECVVVIEASIADESPRFNNVVEYLSYFDYKVYDIIDPLYRKNDWHLWQVDLIFVKTTSSFWGSKDFY